MRFKLWILSAVGATTLAGCMPPEPPMMGAPPPVVYTAPVPVYVDPPRPYFRPRVYVEPGPATYVDPPRPYYVSPAPRPRRYYGPRPMRERDCVSRTTRWGSTTRCTTY